MQFNVIGMRNSKSDIIPFHYTEHMCTSCCPPSSVGAVISYRGRDSGRDAASRTTIWTPLSFAMSHPSPTATEPSAKNAYITEDATMKDQEASVVNHTASLAFHLSYVFYSSFLFLSRFPPPRIS
ncbi:hypothetical protein PVAG01_07892 [Phlyctema vagabunda]|uniref:Uncharacterized protein n=1 Tax=Phlyctema vagabunda TaxID=108571 RepID=A0ABR4PE85_9HELO